MIEMTAGLGEGPDGRGHETFDAELIEDAVVKRNAGEMCAAILSDTTPERRFGHSPRHQRTGGSSDQVRGYDRQPV